MSAILQEKGEEEEEEDDDAEMEDGESRSDDLSNSMSFLPIPSSIPTPDLGSVKE